MKKKRYRGVEYYKGADLAKGHMLEKAKEVYDNLKESHIIENINEVIELYNINKYVDDGLLLQYVGEDREGWLNEKNKIANAFVGRYIGSHNSILSEYENLDFRNKATFWEIVGERKLSSFDGDDLLQVLNEQEYFVCKRKSEDT